MVTVLVAALAVTGCSAEEPDPVPAAPLGEPTETGPPAYDAALASAPAVLALVPDDATTLSVTDFEQVRLVLGASLLTGESPAAERARFWRQAEEDAPLLSTGMLRPVEARLLRDYGFTQDDVAWEASFSGPAGEGWVLSFRDDLDLDAVRRAVDDGVGPLSGAEVDADNRLVSSGTAPDGESSWAADAELVSLVSQAEANATHVQRECVPFEYAFGADVADELAATPAADLAELETLEAWSLSFGGLLATARLGTDRTDVFERMRLAENLPATEPEFAMGFTDGVADPVGGRIGYSMPDPAAAALLTRQRNLPFAVCTD
ncbi:hypothetical protein NSZ01_29330 [Nocardioides szechwanensis]|uniref:Uncharacterized protein n=1 Tax=Nocardioides szechwanensis TaxID=1005944 RepID=A0A1H0DJB5_9ACTN|nr:hypothetical protein NSZ01_29330 [Nocardioides szechwanensis]SDN70347.1 hypothetical protein SAMN05192576_2590 [Nocardioides szechwanensis]